MKSFAMIVAFLVASTIVVVESQIIIGAAIAAAIALKAAAVIGFGAGAIISRRGGGGGRGGGRWGRSAEPLEVDAIMLDASHNDALDCAKKLVCTINTKPVSQLNEEEKAIAELFGSADHLDVSKDTVEFDLAALMGRKVGAAQCAKIYARCPYERKHLLATVKDAYHNNLF